MGWQSPIRQLGRPSCGIAQCYIAFLRQDWLFGPTSTDTPKTQSICADILSSFAPHTKASLNELSKIMGLPGKSGGSAGTDVERYFLEGKIKEIADYCETDVVNTYRVG